MTLQWVPPVTYVDSPEDMMKFVRHVRDTKRCAIDTETTGLNRWSDIVLLWSACPDIQSRYCFTPRMLDIYSEELARDPSIEWYFTNQTFDFCMLSNTNAVVPHGNTYCTLAMDWLYDENRQGRHGLKETAKDHLDFDMREFKETFGVSKRGESIQERLLRALEDDFDSAINYASTDAWATFRVFEFLRGKLSSMESFDGTNYWDYFRNVESPFTRTLYNCIQRGIRVNLEYLEELSPKLESEIISHHKNLNRIAGKEINPNSTKQLRELFFDKLQLEPIKLTSGGASGNRQPSTDEECLTKWSEMGVDAAEIVLSIRNLVKIKGTYVDGLRKWVDPEDRIHPTLTQHVTVTGRLSSVDPNLQNIPRPGGDKFGLRSAFIPRDGYVFVVADYEQLEMRLLAHIAEDKNMIDVINKGWDIHSGTASLMFDYNYDELQAALKKKKAATKDKSLQLSELEEKMCFARQASKTIGFGLNYGEGIKKLAKTLNVSEERAKELKEIYFRPYPSVKSFISSVHAFIRDEYMVETILGRPRRFPDLKGLRNIQRKFLTGHEKQLLAMCERQSVNSIIQGSAADVARMAMINCERSSRLRKLGVEMLLQVHDELIFEVPEECVDEARPLIVECMEHPFDYGLSVPLSVDVGVGTSWSGAKA